MSELVPIIDKAVNFGIVAVIIVLLVFLSFAGFAMFLIVNTFIHIRNEDKTVNKKRW